MAAIRADAAAHGVVELGQAPVADAIGAGRNVGRLEAAERRHQRRAAAQPQPGLALGALCGMAGRAAASMKQTRASGVIARTLRPLGLVKRLRRGDEPAGQRAQQRQPGQSCQQPFHISSS